MNRELKKLIDKESAESASTVVKACEQSYGFWSTGFSFIDSVVSPEGLFPRGCISELMGQKSTCKTTLALHALSNAIAASQNKPPVIVWADFENQLLDMKKYAAALGVDIGADNFIHIRPTTLEEGSNFILKAVRTGGVDFIVIDSNAAMRPSTEAKNLVGGTHQKGLRSLLISEFIRNLNADMMAVSNSGRVPPTVIILNQVYLKLNIGGPPSFGPPQYDSPGSGSIKFYAAARYELKQTGSEYRKLKNQFTLEDMRIRAATYITLFVEKCKVAIPHNKVSFAVRFGEGVDPLLSFMKAAEKAGIIKKNGARFSAILPDGNTTSSYAGFYGLYDALRADHALAIKIAENSEVRQWHSILSARMPWVEYARKVMVADIQHLESGVREIDEGSNKLPNAEV